MVGKPIRSDLIRCSWKETRLHVVNLISTLTNSHLIDTINKNIMPGDKLMTQDQVIKAVPLPGVQFLSGKFKRFHLQPFIEFSRKLLLKFINHISFHQQH